MLTRRWPGLVLLAIVWGTSHARVLTMEERLAAQRAMEEVHWRHRSWPEANPTPKPPLDQVLPAGLLRAKVEDVLAKSDALARIWQQPITARQLQAELDRMARDTRAPRVLQELFDALDGDALLAAEMLARPALADRLLRSRHAGGPDAATPFEAWWRAGRAVPSTGIDVLADAFTLPPIASGGCTNDAWRPTAIDMADPRRGHTAVWTGAEMIVWGGENQGPEYNTGGRYDPATDTWSPTSMGAGVPRGRIRHSVVWTGTEMIVWGGASFDPVLLTTKLLRDGARYDPASDTWSPTSSAAGLPEARSAHTAVWTGTEMVVWGGRGAASTLSSGARYDPSTDTWIPTSAGPNAASPRSEHRAVWTGTEMIVWGGQSPVLAILLDTGARYRPSTDTWLPMATAAGAPSPRSSHTAVWTGSEMIVWGGRDGDWNALGDGGRYDPGVDAWTVIPATSDAPTARLDHVAVWTGTRMIVWGGDASGDAVFLDTGGQYDPAAGAWTPTSLTGAPVVRTEHTAVWTGTEMIVWGGVNLSRCPLAGGRYDPASDTWIPTSTGTLPEPRFGHTASWTGAEMIVWGGTDGYVSLASGGRYVPATDTWVPTSTAPAARQGHTAVWTGTEIIVWGGGGQSTGARYDPATDTWRPTSVGANAPSARPAHTAVWTGTEMIVWGGGWMPTLATGARYDPRADAWTPTSTLGAPVGRQAHTAIWTGTEMIVWGGQVALQGSPQEFVNTGGRYDPATDSWTPTSTGAGVPSARRGPSAVWTGTEMIIWGGGEPVGNGYLSTGARYDPATNTWAPTASDSSTPAPRNKHAAVWTGAEMIVWGGQYPRQNTGGRYHPATNAWTATSTGPYVPVPRTDATGVWTGTEMIVWGGIGMTATGGLYCACPNGVLAYADVDGDGSGNPAISTASCDGGVPGGYVTSHGDCNDSDPNVYPGAAEICNGTDDDCDGAIDDGGSGEDEDGDAVRHACDDCPLTYDPTQSDGDGDGEGDACDLDDGLIWEWRDDASTMSWQAEQGPTLWNVYVGDLGVLRTTGVYTQTPGSNELASRSCGLSSTSLVDAAIPPAGKVSFSLVTGVTNGVEGSLGPGASGERPNHDPCP